MKPDYNDPLFTERGIDPIVAEAQDFLVWDDENYPEVISLAFANLSEHKIRALTRKAEQGPGVIITRHSPIVAPEKVVPEIRPNKAVETKHHTRHIHGAEEVCPFSLLPSHVEAAVCIPDIGYSRIYKLKFYHNHGTLGAEELAKHIVTWHGETDRANGVRKSHGHTVSVLPANVMYEHSASDGSKITFAHTGPNAANGAEIHQHVGLAKYLFASSETHDVNTDKHHNHEEEFAEDPEGLERHLTRYHRGEGNEEEEEWQ